MPTRFLTSDQHIGHANIIKFCNRPFGSVDEMNETLVDRWNEVVAPEDTVFVLGDVALGKLDESLSNVARLNGTKILVPGNHDRAWVHDPRNRHPEKGYERLVTSIQRYLDAGFDKVIQASDIRPFVTLPGLDFQVRLHHFPYEGDSHGDDRYTDIRPKDEGGWIIHGHVHDSWRQRGRQINVGVDAWNGYPVSEATLAQMVQAGERSLDPIPWSA